MIQSLKDRAIKLRRRGWSYNIIAERLGVGKGALSAWLRTLPYTPNQAVIKRIRAGPAKAAAVKQKVKLEQILSLKAQGQRKIARISDRDLLFLGLGLYMGEGSKLYESVRLINSDPHIVKVAMQWFRRTCGVPERNFAVRIHLYPDTSSEAALTYWSKMTGLTRRQFERVQVDRRTDKSGKKRRRLPYGTAHIKVYSRGDSRFGVALHRQIIGWVEAAYGALRA